MLTDRQVALLAATVYRCAQGLGAALQKDSRFPYQNADGADAHVTPLADLLLLWLQPPGDDDVPPT